MEKIKPILAGLVKYHFWVLLGIVVVVALFTWNSAVGHLDSEFSQNKSKIDSQFNKVNGLNSMRIELDSGESRFANEKWQETTLKEAAQLRSEVRKAWKVAYDRQQQAKHWPDLTETFPGPKFGAVIEIMPAETLVPTEPEDLATPYKAALLEQIAALPALVSAVEVPEYDPASGRRKPTPTNPMETMMLGSGGVLWEAENYYAIQDALQPPKEELTSGWVREAQEDIWVYQMVLSTINKVNGEKDKRDEFNLPINRIKSIHVGLPVTRWMEVGRPVESVPDPTAVAGGEGGVPATAPTADEDGEEPEEEKEPGRYVDDERSPVGFKSLPVRISVEMKLEKLSELMLELGNAAMTTEIVDLYVNDDRGAGGGARPKKANTIGTRTGFGGEFSGSLQAAGNKDDEVVAAKNPTVEIWALVHFAEVPDDDALMSEKEKEEKAAAEKAAQEEAEDE